MNELQEIKGRLAAASTGPWIVENGAYTGKNWLIGSMTFGKSDNGKSYLCHITTDNVYASELLGDAKTDAEFVACARTDMKWLVERVETLKKERDELKTANIKLIGRLEEYGEYHPYPELTKDEIDKELRAAGLDPDEVERNGREFIAKELEAFRQRIATTAPDVSA